MIDDWKLVQEKEPIRCIRGWGQIIIRLYAGFVPLTSCESPIRKEMMVKKKKLLGKHNNYIVCFCFALLTVCELAP